MCTQSLTEHRLSQILSPQHLYAESQLQRLAKTAVPSCCSTCTNVMHYSYMCTYHTYQLINRGINYTHTHKCMLMSKKRWGLSQYTQHSMYPSSFCEHTMSDRKYLMKEQHKYSENNQGRYLLKHAMFRTN